MQCESPQMPHRYGAPTGREILGHEPPVAVLRPVLAAQQARAIEQLPRHGRLDAPRFHKRQKPPFVTLPRPAAAFDALEQLLRRRQLRQVQVIDLRDGTQEVAQVVLLRESRELRAVVEPHVDDAPHAGVDQQPEEASALFLVKPIVARRTGIEQLKAKMSACLEIELTEAAQLYERRSPLARSLQLRTPMQTYRCTCGNRLFFDNTQCVVCGREVGWCEACRRITALEPLEDNLYRCSHADCGERLRKCHNYAVENVCNRCFPASRHEGSQPPVASPIQPGAAVVPPEVLCLACELTETIPDLAVAGNREKWARLEAAKRRLLYMLDRLGLPYAEAQPRLTFAFKGDAEPPPNDWRDAGPGEIVYTGHADGMITINIREADDAEREKLRVTFHEAHRTLIGHFRHEVGHYYWQLLVQGQRKHEREFKKLFGDYNALPYPEAMADYYKNGPRADWAASYISAYASAHPWEDFAETFALYLDIVSVLDTATHLFKSVRANFRSRSVAPLVERFQEVGILVNEFNRTMGLLDLVPEVVIAPVVPKLEFIHKLLKAAADREGTPAAPQVAADPIPVLLQEGPAPIEPAIIVGERPHATATLPGMATLDSGASPQA